MLTLTFSLRFRDGETVVASIKAHSRMEDALVTYAGPAKRLPFLPPTANAVELRAYFKSFARELKAVFLEQERDDQTPPLLEIDRAFEALPPLQKPVAQKKPPSRPQPPGDRTRPRC